MMSDIAGRRNPQIRLARSLRSGKGRRETGLFLVEGLRHIGELLESDLATEFILYAPETLDSEYGAGLLRTARGAGIPVHSTSADILDSLSEKASGATMIAVARRPEWTLDGLETAPPGWSVALAAPRDPGNIGAIVRSMDAFRAGSLFLLDGGADPWQPGAVRASMGAIFTHPVVEASFADFTDWASGLGVPLCGTSAHAAEDIRFLSAVPAPAVLLFGSEREGLTPEQRAACAQVFRIPIHGRGTSLNLAVAAGIALYNTIKN